MKFLCIECDRQMTFEERELPAKQARTEQDAVPPVHP